MGISSFMAYVHLNVPFLLILIISCHVQLMFCAQASFLLQSQTELTSLEATYFVSRPCFHSITHKLPSLLQEQQ